INGSFTAEIKDSNAIQYLLSNNSVVFDTYWSDNSNDNTKVSFSITSHSYTSVDGWQDLTAKDFDNGHTVGKTIQSKAIQINKEAFNNTDFKFYLKITKAEGSASKYANVGDKMYSDAGQMIALTSLTTTKAFYDAVIDQLHTVFDGKTDIPTLADGTEYKFMFLGCEDTSNQNSDWDMNDVVFLLVGLPDLPEVHHIDDEYIRKRYMIEDLGSTFDFDFNDIVVDVTQHKHTDNDDVTITQTAELKHLCGTIPFQIGFGSDGDIYWFPIMPGQNNDAEQGGEGYTPSGDSYSSMLSSSDNLYQNSKHYWNPNTNNIYVRVWPNAAGILPEGKDGSWTDEQLSGFLGELGSKTFTFPTTGEYPYIIACDQNVNWMKELITIPTSWFSVSPKNNNPQYGDGTTPTPTPDEGNEDDPETGDDNTGENHRSITWNQEINFALSNSDWSKDCRMVNTLFNSVEAGDEIVVYIDNVQSDKDAKLCPMTGNWDAFNTNNAKYNWNDKTFNLYVNSDIATSLKASGMAIQGKGFTVKSVKLKKVKNVDWNATYNFALTDDNWFNYAMMDKSKFSDINTGDVITVNISNVKSGAQGAFQSNWQNIVDTESLDGKTSFSLTVTDDIKSKLQNNGLSIQGKGYTITNITKSSSNTDPTNPEPSGDSKTWTINQASHSEYFEYFMSGNDGYEEFITSLQNGMTKLTVIFSSNGSWVNLIYGNNGNQVKDPNCYQKTSATVDLSDKVQSIIDNGGVRIQSGDAVVSSFTLEKP
ncbi:MAG: hypothetical protein KBT06_04560, partial [Prevotellaceae bacterium]|nr:hypothetical protein [Candidatus Colivivens equi]